MKKKVVLFIAFILIFFVRLSITSFKEPIFIEKQVEVIGRVNAGKGKIERINGKYPRENLYFLVDKISDGEKKIVGKITKIKETKWGIYYYIDAEKFEERKNFIKSFILSKIKKISQDYSIDMEDFLRATILGEGYLLDNSLKEKFRYTGTTHILVISGLHIGVIISGLELIFLKLRIKKRVREMSILAILTLYLLGIGATPSVVRAYIMGAIYLLSGIFYEKTDSKKTFLVSLVVSLLIFPHWIFSISFLMSYIAVFSIIFIFMKIPKIKRFKIDIFNKIIELSLLSLTIQICMAPVMIIFFKTIAIFAFICNIIIVPIASLFIILSFLTIFLSNFYLDFLISPILYYLYNFMMYLIDVMNKIPYLSLEL